MSSICRSGTIDKRSLIPTYFTITKCFYPVFGTKTTTTLKLNLGIVIWMACLKAADQMDYDVSFWQLFYNFNSTIGKDRISKFRTVKTESK
jgi:hypothetical protein